MALLNFYPDKASFENLGFKFLNEKTDSEKVQFPVGWRKKRKTYALISIVDEVHRLRGCMIETSDKKTGEKIIMFKLYTYVYPSYFCTVDKINVCIRDGYGNIIKTIGECEKTTEDFEVLWFEAIAWLNNNYPDWKNPTKYWE